MGKVVICGCHEAGWNTINHLLANGLKVSWIVSINKEKAEKLRVSGYKSFEDLAKKYNIPIRLVNKYSLKDEEDLAFFSQKKFDILIQGGWQRLFPDDVLNGLRIGAVGVHGSAEFLPKGRGRSPINWSLIEGKTRFILHYFIMKPGADDGDIFHYEFFDINPWDDCNTLYYKSSLITRRVLSEYIPKLLQSDVKTHKQSGEPSYYPKRTPEDGQINWKQGIMEVYNFIRALTRPYPGAYTFMNEHRVNIWKAQPFSQILDRPYYKEGEIIEVFSSGDFLVKCNTGLLLVTDFDSPIALKTGALFDS